MQVKAQDIIQRIAAMEVRGGSAIGRAAVQALALAVAEYDGRDHAELRTRLQRTGQELLRLTPVMATVASAARAATQLLEDRIRAGASLGDIKAAFQTWADEEIRRSEERLDRLAEYGANIIQSGATVMTHSLSDSVLRTLRAVSRQRKIIQVIATESRPLLEGRRTLEAAAELGFSSQLIPDAAMASRVQDATVALVGADAILPSGAFVNKTGTFLLALAAGYFGVPLYVAAETTKVDPRTIEGHPPILGERSPEELTQGWTPPRGVTVWNRFFELTPGECVEAYVTEEGLVGPGGIGALRRDLIDLTTQMGAHT
jgi:ribose 1,5-bisphosphate isomerase